MTVAQRRFLVGPELLDISKLPETKIIDSIVGAYMIANNEHQAWVRMINARYCMLYVRTIDERGAIQEIKAPISLNMFEKNAKSPIGRQLAYKRHSYAMETASIVIHDYQQALQGLMLAEVNAPRRSGFKASAWFGSDV